MVSKYLWSLLKTILWRYDFIFFWNLFSFSSFFDLSFTSMVDRREESLFCEEFFFYYKHLSSLAENNWIIDPSLWDRLINWDREDWEKECCWIWSRDKRRDFDERESWSSKALETDELNLICYYILGSSIGREGAFDSIIIEFWWLMTFLSDCIW